VYAQFMKRMLTELTTHKIITGDRGGAAYPYDKPTKIKPPISSLTFRFEVPVAVDAATRR
jgi:hypothetical protein